MHLLDLTYLSEELFNVQMVGQQFTSVDQSLVSYSLQETHKFSYNFRGEWLKKHFSIVANCSARDVCADFSGQKSKTNVVNCTTVHMPNSCTFFLEGFVHSYPKSKVLRNTIRLIILIH